MDCGTGTGHLKLTPSLPSDCLVIHAKPVPWHKLGSLAENVRLAALNQYPLKKARVYRIEEELILSSSMKLFLSRRG